MNIFNNLKLYDNRWRVKSVRKFTVEEIAMVEKAQVIESQYGGSVCFFLKNGMATSVPLDNDAKSRIGDFIDMNTAEIVTLAKYFIMPVGIEFYCGIWYPYLHHQ